MSSGRSVETASVVTHAPPRRDSPRAASHGRLGAAAPARDHGGHRRAPARLDRLARTRSRAAVGARPADALPAARRGRRLPPHRPRGQPADGSPPPRPSRPRGGARDGARSHTSDGRLGIEVWCYNWMPIVSWSRTSTALEGRGGAVTSRFDADRLGGQRGPRRSGRRGAPLGDPRLVPRARRSGRRGGGREARAPPGRPAALARPWDRANHHEHRRLRPRLRPPAEPGERDDDVPGQRGADDRRSPGSDPPLRQRGPHPLRPLPRRPRHARATSRRRSSTTARPTWRRAFVPTSRQAWTHHFAPTTRRRSRATRLLVPGYPTLGRLHAIGYVQGLLAACQG